MPCTKASLLNTFNQAVNIFNKGADNTIGGLLDENVTIYSYRQVQYSGIANAEQYFTKEFTKEAQFYPTVTSYNVSDSGTTAQVSGSANWTSTSTEHLPGGKESFDFQFQFVCENGQWLLLNLNCWNQQE
jgi:hypothetical protein